MFSLDDFHKYFITINAPTTVYFRAFYKLSIMFRLEDFPEYFLIINAPTPLNLWDLNFNKLELPQQL